MWVTLYQAWQISWKDELNVISFSLCVAHIELFMCMHPYQTTFFLIFLSVCPHFCLCILTKGFTTQHRHRTMQTSSGNVIRLIRQMKSRKLIKIRINLRNSTMQMDFIKLLTRIRRIACTISVRLLGRGTSCHPISCNKTFCKWFQIENLRQRFYYLNWQQIGYGWNNSLEIPRPNLLEVQHFMNSIWTMSMCACVRACVYVCFHNVCVWSEEFRCGMTHSGSRC